MKLRLYWAEHTQWRTVSTTCLRSSQRTDLGEAMERELRTLWGRQDTPKLKILMTMI